MHFGEPTFRESYPVVDKPYATEYRPGMHAKVGPRKYFLSGSDRDGRIRLISFMCASETTGYGESTLTDIPQTGKIVVKGPRIYVNGDEKSNITADEMIRLRADGEQDIVPADTAEEVMILGLEFDKMLSDTSMYSDPDAEQRFVRKPLARSMEAIGEYTQTDPAAITSRLLSELAKYWPKVKPNKSR